MRGPAHAASAPRLPAAAAAAAADGAAHDGASAAPTVQHRMAPQRLNPRWCHAAANHERVRAGLRSPEEPPGWRTRVVRYHEWSGGKWHSP